MTKTHLLIGGAITAGAVWLCWRDGHQRQRFTGVDAVRMGAAHYVKAFAKFISPVPCCAGCAGNGATATPPATTPPAPTSTAIIGSTDTTSSGVSPIVPTACGSV